jgi:aminoglycoside/choline kinase family phosphotransferase
LVKFAKKTKLKQDHNKLLRELFRKYSGQEVTSVEPLVGSGSNRQYYRLKNDSTSVIGVFGSDKKENKAFFTFTHHFLKHGLYVPEIYLKDENTGVYLLQDLGDQSLFHLLMEQRSGKEIPGQIAAYYKNSLEELIRFQVAAGKNLDYSVCHPRAAFDRQSMQWDLNYFKYYFLRPSGVVYDEQKLEDDFSRLMDFLSKAPADYFMYRDFMTRNILIHQNRPYFIDYQGGRKGPLQYDLASLLFQARADLPFVFREQMLEFYMDLLEKHFSFDRAEFVDYYYGFVWIRTLQVLGAYGYRGNFERKPHFLQSTDFALKNVRWLLDQVRIPVELPELFKSLERILEQKSVGIEKTSSHLTVEINSFSFIYMGIPEDESEHGGGFVFDCRSLPNPGRYEEYRTFTGRDQKVIDYLKKAPEVDRFLRSVYEIIDQAIDNYIQRGFDRLMVSFGCTGGQHRSVYCAENLFRHIREKYNVDVRLNHRMLLK